MKVNPLSFLLSFFTNLSQNKRQQTQKATHNTFLYLLSSLEKIFSSYNIKGLLAKTNTYFVLLF